VQPKKYFFEEHGISPKNVDEHAFYVIEKLKSKGFNAYLVGGGVRDLLLKQVPKDFDISTSAEPKEIKNIFKNCILIGKRFRLAHVRFGKKTYEVSTFRAGDISTSELILRDNVWGSEEEDALRRDFTINGLFYDTEKGCIIDYVGGFEDAREKLLRSIGDAKIRFIQDPVRMIRLLKFKARFGFNIEKNTLEALEICKNEIVKSSQARILEELLRMLVSGASEPFFRLLHSHNLLRLLLPLIDSNLDKEEKIYKLLKEADIYQCKHEGAPLDRCILLACLIFPMLERKIAEKKERPHLGIIVDEAKELVNQVFYPFFHISRRIKATIVSIMINQYRFVPVSQKRRLRIPKDPFFNLAMTFFKLRSMVDSTLLEIYTLWHEHMVAVHHRSKNSFVKRQPHHEN
jgi:poly(A) polymerase